MTFHRPYGIRLLIPLFLALGRLKGGVVDRVEIKDPDLVRFYSFAEGHGGTVRQWAGNGEGELVLVGKSPYGEPQDRRIILKPDFRATCWREGRFPGTFSVQPGEEDKSVVHTRFYQTKTGTFSLEAWIRPRDGKGAFLWAGDGLTSGFSLSHDPQSLFWRIGTGSGPVQVNAPALQPGLWHQVVAVWDAAANRIALYADGVLLAEKAATSPFVATTPLRLSYVDEESDWDGLRIGGGSRQGAARFEIDQLAVYARALTATEIAGHYKKGRPSGSGEEQLAEFAREEKRENILDRIQLSVPSGTHGYFPVSRPLPIHLEVPGNDLFTGKLNARWKLEDIEGKELKKGQRELQVSPSSGAKEEVPLKIEKCGLYFLQLEVLDPKGQVLKQVEYPVGMIVDLPPAGERPKQSPLAAHGAVQMWPEAGVLGFDAIDRIIMNVQEPRPGVYDFSAPEEIIDLARERGMGMMFCIGNVPSSWEEGPGGRFGTPAFNLDNYRALLTATVRHFKGRVRYWEILNEPNGGGYDGLLGTGQKRAENYVKLLKAAYEVVKKEDPSAQVVGISGAPGFVAWTEAVMAAGAAPWFDIATVHNYRAAPIQYSHHEEPIVKVRQILKHYGKDAPVWDGEFGINQAARIDGRPMAAKDFYKTYFRRMSTAYGFPVTNFDTPVVPEAVCAAWNTQAVLLDLAEGAQRVCILVGANRYFPQISSSEGTPSEKGVAMAAMAKVLLPMEKAERFPLSSNRDAGVLIHLPENGRDLALFSDDKPELIFHTTAKGVVHGADWLGNPKEWEVDESELVHVQLDEHPLYLRHIGPDFSQVPLISVAAPDELTAGRITGNIVLINPSSKEASYQLKYELPKGVAVECASSAVVPAKGKREVPFVLMAKDLGRGTHEVNFSISGDGGTLVAKTQHLLSAKETSISIPESGSSFPLRANLADWKNIPPVKVAEDLFVLSGKPLPGLPWAPQWKGPNDLSFSYRLAWQPDGGLALLIEVTDDQLRIAPPGEENIFRYDCAELFLDFRPQDLRRVGYSPGAAQFLIRPADSNTAQDCVVRNGAGDASGFDVHFVGRRTPTGYVMEGRIKPKSEALMKMKEGTSLALDLFIDDSDEQLRKTIMGIGYGSLQNSISTSDWGWFKLNSSKESAK